MKLSIKKYLINTNASIINCYKRIESNEIKCLIVVDKDLRLLGTLNDGDIRRGLLKKNELRKKNIEKIYKRDPFCVFINEVNHTKLRKILISKKLGIIPVVNKDNKVLDVIDENYLNKYKKNNVKNKLPQIPIVIMAGGEGKRLSPFTQILPKPLIPIKNKTVVENIIDNYLTYGQKNYYLSVNYKKEILKSYFDEIKKKYNLTYIEEKKALGTAGSLYLLKKKIKKTFILCNCDILAKFNLEKLYEQHIKNKNDVTIISALKSTKINYGTLLINRDNEFVKIEEKPIFKKNINIGIYMINPSILKKIKNNNYLNFTDLLNQISNECKVGIFKISDKNWKDVGEWDKYYNLLKK